MTVDFGDYFWGEKNDGFNVLYHNMKHGLVASKELADFLRERSTIEELNSKQLSKLAKQASSGSVQGTFAPIWQLMRNSADKLSTLHLQMVQKVTELVKEVSKYADDMHKKHKLVKEEESGTLEIVQTIQSTALTVQKAKDAYMQKAMELEKIGKDNGSPKDLEKAEIKYKKAQEDYKVLVEKYSNIQDDFEKKMSLACRHFQDVEEAHLKQMKEFLNSYADMLDNNHDLIGQVHIEFKRQCLDMTVDKLLEQFVSTKYTGLEKPGPIEFEELNMSGLSSSGVQTPDSSDKTPTNGDKPSKKEGNNESGGQKVKESKSSRRTTSLLNLFMSNSQGGKETSGNPEGKAEGGSLPTSAPTSPTSGGQGGAPPAGGNPLARMPLRGSKCHVPEICVPSLAAPGCPRNPSESLGSCSCGNPSAPPPDSCAPRKIGFLRSRRDKRKEKKTKKKKDADNSSNKEEKSDLDDKDDSRKSGSPSLDVDEEGFCIRPKVDLWDNDKGSFYSSSDSDSDDDRGTKIHVEIKPLSNGSAPMSASVDELRATVETLSLSPTPIVPARRGSNNDGEGHIKRSQSVSQQIGGMTASGRGTPGSTPTGGTPTGGTHPYAPLNSPGAQPLSSSPADRSMASNRYADLGDLFSEVGEMQPALPPKQSRGGGAITPGLVGVAGAGGSIAIPRPPSRRGDGAAPRGRVSPGIMARADSVGSLEFRAAGVPVGSSRGPSPLTIGMADTIPLAVAFHEVIHSYFRGSDESRCQVKMCGDMMLSFPAGIVSVLANNPSPALLAFRVRNTMRLENILPNKQLVTMDSAHSNSESTVFEFNMSALTGLLRRQSEQNPAASYFNVDILKYQIKAKPGAGSCPFQLVAYWKCETGHTDLKVDYKYNSHAMASASPLLNLTVAVPVDGGVKNLQAKPNAQWLGESGRAVWKLTELSAHSAQQGVGSLRARLELSNGPGNQGTIATHFNCEGTTLSGADFELFGAGYRVSLVKRRFVAGKYICDGDYADPKSRYAAPPSNVDC